MNVAQLNPQWHNHLPELVPGLCGMLQLSAIPPRHAVHNLTLIGPLFCSYDGI